MTIKTSYMDKTQASIYQNFPEEHYLSDPSHVYCVMDWITYYRRNLHRFIQHYLGLTLHFYQVLILFLMNLYPSFCFVASRASAKSYLIAIFSCAKAILYPGSQIVVASGTKGQAKLIVTEKIQKELMRESAILRMEIATIKSNNNDIEVIFRNGSSIVVVPANDNARGHRATIIIYEEFRMIKKSVIDSILSPFLIVRQPPYIKLPQYSNNDEVVKEEPISIYISSSWYTSHWMWDTMKVHLNAKYKNDSMCIVGLDYSITLKHNLRTRNQLMSERKKMDRVSWEMEYENLMISENTNAYFTYNMLQQNQTLKKPFYPRNNWDVFTGKRAVNKMPKLKEEIRIVACDMAFIENKRNDNSIFSCIRLIPETSQYVSQSDSGSKVEVKKGYRRSVVYLESVQGGDTTMQAIRIKQLFDDFEADYVVLDLRNGGIGIYDILAKVIYDESRDKEYLPWTCINDESIANRIKTMGASPVVFVINASQKLNSDIAIRFRTDLMEKRIDLLINLGDAKEQVLANNTEYMSAIDEDQILFYEKPYLETQALINETIDLVYERLPQTGAIRVSEQGANRKDRYTSVSYGNYFASILEQDLFSNMGEYEYVSFLN